MFISFISLRQTKLSRASEKPRVLTAFDSLGVIWKEKATNRFLFENNFLGVSIEVSEVVRWF